MKKIHLAINLNIYFMFGILTSFIGMYGLALDIEQSPFWELVLYLLAFLAGMLLFYSVLEYIIHFEVTTIWDRIFTLIMFKAFLLFVAFSLFMTIIGVAGVISLLRNLPLNYFIFSIVFLVGLLLILISFLTKNSFGNHSLTIDIPVKL